MKYEKWSLGYWFLKIYIRFADWLIYKQTIITGSEKIPAGKPILFAPNHQNALSDPLAVLLHTRFQPVWLGRADIFGKSKIVDAILKFMKIMPVYRIRDGKETLMKNEKTFSDSIKVLENNFALAVFPEAAHSFKRQMLVHKKAVPRIVFMAEEKTGNQLDIQIIPVGIYYSHYWKFNRSAIVNFGDPVAVKDFLDTYSQNPNSAVIALKSKIYDSLLPLVINIKSKDHYGTIERIREIYGNHFLKREGLTDSLLNRFRSDQKLVVRLDEVEALNPEKMKDLASEVNDYYSRVQKNRLRSWLIDEDEKHLLKLAGSFLMLLTGLPLLLYGFLLNSIPFFLVDRVVRKKIRDKSFWSTFFLVAGIVIFPIFYLLAFFAVGRLLPGFWLQAAFLFSLPFAGKFAFKWYILWRKTVGRGIFLGLKWFQPEMYLQLTGQKNQLIKKLDELVP